MRFKNRYLVVWLRWREGVRVGSDVRDATVIETVRESVRVNFGAVGDAATYSSLQVKHLNPATGIMVVRCAREVYRDVWAAMTLVTAIEGKQVALHVLHTAGSVRTARREALRLNLAAITWDAEGNRSTSTSSSGGGGGGRRLDAEALEKLEREIQAIVT